jgi:hypothetical protein
LGTSTFLLVYFIFDISSSPRPIALDTFVGTL